MYGQIIIKDIFSIFNILLIAYLLIDPKPNLGNKQKNWYSYILCIGSLATIRIMLNNVSLHIVYNYITIIFIVMIIGHFLFQRSIKYCLLIGSAFLSIVLLGQLLSCIFFYRYSSNAILADLPDSYQVCMILIAEIVIAVGSLVIKRIVRKIPLLFSGIHIATIIVPLFINIIVMAICADQTVL